MAMPVTMSGVAKEKLRGIPDPSVRAQILHLAYTELAPPRGSALDGVLRDSPSVMWRRVVPFAQLSDFLRFTIDGDDEYRYQACDYVLLYRWMTRDEQIEFRISEKTLLVVDIWDNRGLTPYLAS